MSTNIGKEIIKSICYIRRVGKEIPSLGKLVGILAELFFVLSNSLMIFHVDFILLADSLS